MKLNRPHVPIDVKIAVIARQLLEDGKLMNVLTVAALTMKSSDQLTYLLKCKFGDERVHLDHDPPLCLREIIDADAGMYKPDARDPHYLVYRTADEHRIKTFVRGDGAQFSDAAKRRRQIKRLLAETKQKLAELPQPSRWPPRGHRKIASRPFPKKATR